MFFRPFLGTLWDLWRLHTQNSDFAGDILQKWVGDKMFLCSFLGALWDLWLLHGQNRDFVTGILQKWLGEKAFLGFSWGFMGSMAFI